MVDLSTTKQAHGVTSLILNAFETELDALLRMLDTEGEQSDIIRRYGEAEKLFGELRESVKRVAVKYDMIGSRLIDGSS